jgi:putative transposase
VKPHQQELTFRTWGGKRKGAGRKPKVGRARVSHCSRPEHKKQHPVHVTLRAARRLPSLRKQAVFMAIRRAFTRTARAWFRLIHYSVQADHIHLLVEADDKVSLSRGLSGLAIRVARAVSRHLRRRGPVLSDRYHARALATPREVRRGIVYVIQNFQKHVHDAGGFDACSSAWWLDGWRRPPSCHPPGEESGLPPVQAPETWLASKGWKLLGLIESSEGPKASHAIRAGRGGCRRRERKRPPSLPATLSTQRQEPGHTVHAGGLS